MRPNTKNEIKIQKNKIKVQNNNDYKIIVRDCIL